MDKITELIVDAYGCRADLSDMSALEASAVAAVTSVGAQVATVASHRFQPHGATLCLILKESHFIVSTWPEHGIAIVNIFLCNSSMDCRKVWEEFSPALRPQDFKFHQVIHRLPEIKIAVA